MADPSLTFLGATETVTGSRFLLQGGARRILVDAGLYQGPAELRRRNWEPFPVDPATIDDVVLTHAHLDHTGYLPRLVREGFGGRVICTSGTAALTAIVLRDSAHLQVEDAAYANRTGYSRHRPALPLYDLGDVEKALPLLTPVETGARIELGGNTSVTLHRAGHILGSSIAGIDVEGHRIVFSGDLGRPDHALLRPPEDPPGAGTIVVESTYGDRQHPARDPAALADVIRRTLGRGGTVLIPAFAVDRTELVLMDLKRLARAGEIPRAPVYVDSPMALAALRVYRRAMAERSPELKPDLQVGGDPFDGGKVRQARTPDESRVLNRPAVPSIVISASGMAAGGRVVHHLEHLLPDPRNTVVLTGYQAVGTRGRQLLDGASQVKIHGRYVPVRAEVTPVLDYSVHADADEILAWLGRAPAPPRTVYVVHGEPAASSRLARRIEAELGWVAVVPRRGERVLLD